MLDKFSVAFLIRLSISLKLYEIRNLHENI